MRQVFLLIGSDQAVNFENQDALPMSDRLWFELESRFSSVQSQSKSSFSLSSEQALKFLRDFYASYELSQPQRRVRLRFEGALEKLASDQLVQFVIAEVSEHRSRRKTS